MQTQLISLLAETDSVFEPTRSWSNPSQISAVMDRRKDFHRRGLSLPRHGDGSDHKRVERERDKLEKTKLVVFHRTNGRRSHWKLSNSTDWFLRRLATWSDFSEAVTILVAVDSLTDDHHTNGRHVADWALALQPGDDGQSVEACDKVAHVGELALPALCRGWLSSWSDIRGANGYAITNAGKAFLASPKAPDLDWPDYSSRSNDIYLEALSAARKNLAATKPIAGEALAIPLSCGDWPGDETRLGQPAIFDSAGKVRSPGDMARAILRSLETAK